MLHNGASQNEHGDSQERKAIQLVINRLTHLSSWEVIIDEGARRPDSQTKSGWNTEKQAEAKKQP